MERMDGVPERGEELNDPANSPIGNAIVAAADGDAPGSGRKARHDGWTPDRIHVFFETLAHRGIVAEAAAAAGMSVQSAYARRNSARGRDFNAAWEAALVLARRRLADEILERALNGYVETIRRDGKVVAERHRHDDRQALAVLARLDERARSFKDTDRAITAVADEFDQFVEIVARGGEGAAGFISKRLRGRPDEDEIFERLERYEKFGVGLPEEIDISDIEMGKTAKWTPEQVARGLAAGLRYQTGDDIVNGDDDGEEIDDDDDEDAYDDKEGWE